MKKQTVVTNATPVNNTVDSSNTKENHMKDATSGTVTLTQAEYAALLTKSTKKAGEKATTCSKKWLCTMKRKEIALSGATPQMQKIMNCVAQEAKEHPDVEYHESEGIVARLMDEDNPDAMTFSKTYRDASEDVRLKRLIEVMNYYAHPDFRAEMTDKFDVR